MSNKKIQKHQNNTEAQGNSSSHTRCRDAQYMDAAYFKDPCYKSYQKWIYSLGCSTYSVVASEYLICSQVEHMFEPHIFLFLCLTNDLFLQGHLALPIDKMDQLWMDLLLSNQVNLDSTSLSDPLMPWLDWLTQPLSQYFSEQGESEAKVYKPLMREKYSQFNKDPQWLWYNLFLYWQKMLHHSHPLWSEGIGSQPFIKSLDHLYLNKTFSLEMKLITLHKHRLNYFYQNNQSTKNHLYSQKSLHLFLEKSPLGEQQKQALLAMLGQALFFLSGGPGTGKTTLIAHFIQYLLTQNDALQVLVCAPTGKATFHLLAGIHKIIPAQAGIQAFTIHKLIHHLSSNIQNSYDLLIIDESSMISAELWLAILEKLPLQTPIIFVGDPYQLPAIDWANTFEDFVRYYSQYERKLYFELSQSYRSKFLQINELCDKIKKKQPFLDFIEQQSDCLYWDPIQTSHAEDLWKHVFMKNCVSLEKIWENLYQCALQFSINRSQDMDYIQNLSLYSDQLIFLGFQQNGLWGMGKLNEFLYKKYGDYHHKKNHSFFHLNKQWLVPGLPFIITKNDYQENIFNGDRGIIVFIDQNPYGFIFSSENKVYIPLEKLKHYQWSFALSIHKSQGSEYEHVMLIMQEQNLPYLNNQLLYTGVSRAKSAITLYAQKIALETALNHSSYRYTCIEQRLKS